MSDLPRLELLTCRACGAQVDPPVDGLSWCRFCGARSMVLEGVRLAIGHRAAPDRYSADRTRVELRARVARLGLSPPPTLEERDAEILLLARSGRVSARRLPERRGLFGVTLIEGDDEILWFVEDPSELAQEEGSAPPAGLATALRHFDYRVQRAVRAMGGTESATSWDDEVFLIRVPVTEFTLAVPALPVERGWQWLDARPDGRYRVVVDRWRGLRIVDQAPRRVWSVQRMLLLGGFGLFLFFLVTTCPGVLGGLIGVFAGAIGTLIAALGAAFG